VDAERVKVLHVAYGDAIVIAVANHFVLNLFPTFEALFNQYLRRERKSFLGEAVKFLFIVAKTRTESTECIGSTDDDRVAQFLGSLAGLFDVLTGFALDGLYIYLVEFFNEEFPVFGVHDGLYGCSEHLQVIFFEDSAFV